MPEVVEDSSGVAEEVPAGVFSRYGLFSAVLGVVSVIAAVLVGLICWHHRQEAVERSHQTDAMQAAADWTGVLINMNKDNIDASLVKLRDGTAGELNADFEASVQPYRELVQTLQSSTTGQIKSVAIETIHHDLDATPGGQQQQPLPSGMASRTDTVMVVATSVSQNIGAQPQTVRWNLRLGVSDVNGRLLISRLESIR